MSKITINDIAGGHNLAQINAAFQAIEDQLNNKVLYRDNPVGEPNVMQHDLDMNGKKLLNVHTLGVTDSLLIDGLDLATEVGKAQTAATNAETSATSAAGSASAASASALSAAASAATIDVNNLGSGMRVMGLIGNVNATTPLTKYDVSANMVTFRNAGGASITRYNTGTITCDFGLAGPIANGRDQAGTFTLSSFVYIYFIWNGTTIATIASSSSTAPTLPTGYTHYALATSVRWTAASQIVPSYTVGRRVYFNLDEGSATRVIAAGRSTTFATVDCSTLIPPIAMTIQCQFTLSVTHASSAQFSMLARVYGSGLTTGQSVARVTCPAGGAASTTNVSELPLFSQKFDYKLSALPDTLGAYIEMLGYTIPNGDV